MAGDPHLWRERRRRMWSSTVPPSEAAAVVGLMAIFNGLGRLGWASFSDFLGRANTYTLFFVIEIFAYYFLPDIKSIILFQFVLYLILT